MNWATRLASIAIHSGLEVELKFEGCKCWQRMLLMEVCSSLGKECRWGGGEFVWLALGGAPALYVSPQLNSYSSTRALIDILFRKVFLSTSG